MRRDIFSRMWAGTASVFITAALTFTVLNNAQAQPQQNAPNEDLVPLDNVRVKFAEVRPGVDWRKYKSIYLQPLSIPPEARDASPGTGAGTRMGESYVLGDEEVKVLKERFDQVMRNELQKSKVFTLVATPQADTIIIATAIVQLVLAAPLEKTRMSYTGRGRTFTSGAGAATIATALADGGTHAILARVIDNRYAPNEWGVNNTVSNLADLDTIYSRWGADIRRRIEEIQAGTRTMP